MAKEKTKPDIRSAGTDGYSMGDAIRQLYADELEEKVKVPRMKKQGLVIGASIMALIIALSFFVYNFNRFVVLQEQVLSDKGHIHAELQRRQNLFNNLVNLVLDYAAFEQGVFKSVTEIRNSLKDAQAMVADSMNTQPQPEGAGAENQTITGLSNTLTRLMAVVERYPDLKASDVYRALIEKLVETENRIATRREGYNESTRLYNNKISKIPWVWMAKAFRFNPKSYFFIEESVKASPTVKPNTYKKLVPKK